MPPAEIACTDTGFSPRQKCGRDGSSATAALLSVLASSQSEPGGFNAIIRPTISAAHVERQSDTEVDVGVSEGWVAPERVLPLDTGSELAMAEAELQKEQNEVRKKLRTQLREKMEALNELIEPPRFKLSLA